MGSYGSRAGVSNCRSRRDPTMNGDDWCAGTDGFFGRVNFDGLIVQDLPTKVSTATDGLSNTLMIGERWYQLRAWTIGGYWTVEGANSSRHEKRAPKGPWQESAISSAKNVDARYPINANLEAVGFYQSHDYRDRPPLPAGAVKTMAYNDVPFGSFHVGGVNFARGDGSTYFVTDNIDIDTYLAMASRNGGEVVGNN
jgi:hypothetical protein